MASDQSGKGGARPGDRRGPPSSARARAERQEANEAFRQMVFEAVTDKVSASVRAKLEAKAAAHAQTLAPTVREVLDLWTRQVPGARRARFTREEIARTALRIADDEGFEALSMRRLALALDAGTMTLYHYVRTKDELLALVSDAVMAELILDDEELSDGWRSAISNVARRSLATFQRHPWVFDVRDDPAIGPNAVRHFDQSLQALSELDIPLEAKVEILSAVDEFVFGHAFQMRSHYSDSLETDSEVAQYVIELAEDGDYPEISALLDEHGPDAWHLIGSVFRNPDRFERALSRLLDGIEADLLR